MTLAPSVDAGGIGAHEPTSRTTFVGNVGKQRTCRKCTNPNLAEVVSKVAAHIGSRKASVLSVY